MKPIFHSTENGQHMRYRHKTAYTQRAHLKFHGSNASQKTHNQKQGQPKAGKNTTINCILDCSTKNCEDMNIHLSSWRNIIKRFRDSEEISVHIPRPKISIGCSWSFAPLASTAFKHARFRAGNHCLGSGTPPQITMCEHSSPYPPQMQTKAVSCREEAIHEYNMWSEEAKLV